MTTQHHSPTTPDWTTGPADLRRSRRRALRQQHTVKLEVALRRIEFRL